MSDKNGITTTTIWQDAHSGRRGHKLRWTPLAGQVRGQIKIVDCPYRPQC